MFFFFETAFKIRSFMPKFSHANPLVINICELGVCAPGCRGSPASRSARSSPYCLDELGQHFHLVVVEHSACHAEDDGWKCWASSSRLYDEERAQRLAGKWDFQLGTTTFIHAKNIVAWHFVHAAAIGTAIGLRRNTFGGRAWASGFSTGVVGSPV